MSQTVDRQTQLQDSVEQPLRRSRPNTRPAGAETVTTELADGEPRLGALSAAIAKLVSDHGRSPSSATSWRLDERCVVTALEDFITPAEQDLVDRGDAPLVRRLRLAFAEAIKDKYLRAAERALGRAVVVHRSELICRSGICLEILLLATEWRTATTHPLCAPHLQRTPR